MGLTWGITVEGVDILGTLRWEISAFSLLSFCQMRGFSVFSVCILFEESVFIFQFLNGQLCQTKHNCEFYHSKIEHTFLKKYTNWEKLISLVLTEREETKTKYFAPRTTANWTEPFDGKLFHLLTWTWTELPWHRFRACFLEFLAPTQIFKLTPLEIFNFRR